VPLTFFFLSYFNIYPLKRLEQIVSRRTHYVACFYIVSKLGKLSIGICGLVTGWPKHFMPAGSSGSDARQSHTCSLATQQDWSS
jgi:hypothetical protein